MSGYEKERDEFGTVLGWVCVGMMVIVAARIVAQAIWGV